MRIANRRTTVSMDSFLGNGIAFFGAVWYNKGEQEGDTAFSAESEYLHKRE